MILVDAVEHLSIFGNGFSPNKLLDNLHIPYYIFNIQKNDIALNAENEIFVRYLYLNTQAKTLDEMKNMDLFYEDMENTVVIYVQNPTDENCVICVSVLLENEYSSKDKLFNMFTRVVTNGIFV